MVSVRRSRISQLVEAGDLQAQTVQSLQRSLDRLLSTTQLGITLSSLALGWIGEGTMAVLVKHLLLSLAIASNFREYLAHGMAIPIAFLLVAYLQIVLGELCPKSLALRHSEQLARLLGPPIGVIARIFNPFIWILNQSTYFLLRLAGLEFGDRDWHNRVTSEELQLIIATEGESTGLEAKERILLSNVLQFSEIMAVEIMVPRTNVIAIPETATFETVLNEVSTTEHSRYPVKGESLDDILGILDFKELALPLSQQGLKLNDPIEPWIKPARFVPESMTLDELLSLMQRSCLKMVVVVDEYGGTSGLITLQDLIAEIIGDDGESETDDLFSVQMIDDRTFLVDAQMNLEELNEVLDTELPLADEYQTLGGFLLYHWQKIPASGETLNYQNLEFVVVKAEGPRLTQVRIRRLDPEPEIELEFPPSESPDDDKGI